MTKSLPLAIVISTHLIRRLVCQGPNMPLKRGLRAPWGILKCEFLNSEGLLACYISKLIPVVGKLNEKHLTIRLVCRGPPRPLNSIVGMLYKNWSQTHHSLASAEQIAPNSWNCSSSVFETHCLWVVSVTFQQCFYTFRHCNMPTNLQTWQIHISGPPQAP